MSNQALTAEIHRLHCLQALGITVYHPRFRLPGAKPSEQGPWPALAEQSTAERMSQTLASPQDSPAKIVHGEAPKRVEVSLPGAATKRNEVLRSLDMPAVSEAQVTPRTAVPPAPRTERSNVAVQQFQLLFLPIDAELAIVNQVPALARPQLQDKQLALLTNLLRWLGKSVPAQQPRVFRWPLPGLEHMAAETSAETSLLYFLEQAHVERDFRYLLQLGPQAVAAPSQQWQAFNTHSLDEMLALPILKREAWQALLPLHALLHAGN